MIPHLPTDNLYKFATVGAVALMITCLWQGQKNAAEMTSTSLQMKHELFEIGLLGRLIETREEFSQKQTADIQARLSSKTAAQDIMTEATNSTVGDLEKDVEELRSFNKETQDTMTKLFTLQNGSELKKHLLARLEAHGCFYKIGLLISFIISIVSITLWWFRHQRYQDALIKLELEEAIKKRSAQV